MVALLFSACGASVKTTFAPMPPAIYAIAQGAQSGGGGPPPTSFNAYDSATGQVRFSHMLTNDPFGIVTTQDRLGLPSCAGAEGQSMQPYPCMLTVFDASGTQTQQINLGSLAYEEVLASNDAFFVGGSVQSSGATHAQFTAYDAHTGAQRWQNTISTTPYLSNFIVAGQDLIGNLGDANTSLLTAFNTTTGAQVWQASTGTVGGAGGSIVTAGGVVYAVESPNNPSQEVLVAYDAATGAQKWSISPNNAPVQLIAADQNAVYATVPSSSSMLTLTAFAASDGHTLWSVPATDGLSGESGPAPIANGMLYITTTPQGSGQMPSSLLAINTATGATAWSVSLMGTALGTPAIAGNNVYIGIDIFAQGNDHTSIVAFHDANGSPLWQTQTTPSLADPIVALP